MARTVLRSSREEAWKGVVCRSKGDEVLSKGLRETNGEVGPNPLAGPDEACIEEPLAMVFISTLLLVVSEVLLHFNG